MGKKYKAVKAKVDVNKQYKLKNWPNSLLMQNLMRQLI